MIFCNCLITDMQNWYLIILINFFTRTVITKSWIFKLLWRIPKYDPIAKDPY